MSDLTDAVKAVKAAKPASTSCWEPPADLAAALLEQHYGNGVTAGTLAAALDGNAHGASATTVRRWLRRNKPT